MAAASSAKPPAAHAASAAVAAAASGSTRAEDMPRKASSALRCSPSPACAAMTHANVTLSGLTPSLRIASNTLSASAWRPARPHAERRELYVITLHSTGARFAVWPDPDPDPEPFMLLKISKALSTRLPFSHAEITAPYVMESGSTPAFWHSSNISKALSSLFPLAQAEMSAEYVKMFASTPSFFISEKISSAFSHWRLLPHALIKAEHVIVFAATPLAFMQT
mmetsp:Transcript_13963/g.59783  ORF Transcript_13963/g.59783 Transcript_13963/m.59783 type:complete len:223 (-) Transcript_13963:897-1565(-)